MTTRIVEVRFLKGENRRFFGAREDAKKLGYPDVVTYLRATGQVNQWCEEVPEQQVETQIKAEECRQQIKAFLN
jgi:hypothetical protein